MNARLSLFFIAIAFWLVTGSTFGQQDIAGTWQGELQVTPDTAMKLQIIFTAGGNGNYTAEINSPDSSNFKNVPATEVLFNGNRLTLRVEALDLSYSGALKNGVVEGVWAQPGREIPMNLTPFVRTAISADMQEKLSGSWLGMLKAPNGVELGQQQMKFGMDDEGNFAGKVRGINNPWTEFSRIVQSGEELEMRFPVGGTYFRGKVAGDGLNIFMINSSGAKFELNMIRGDYAPPPIVTNLPDNLIQRLIGDWFGEIRLPGATIPVAYYFNSSEEEGFTGIRRINPDRNNNTAIRIREINMKDGKLVITPMAGDGEFIGEFSGEALTGETYTPAGPVATTLEKRN